MGLSPLSNNALFLRLTNNPFLSNSLLELHIVCFLILLLLKGDVMCNNCVFRF